MKVLSPAQHTQYEVQHKEGAEDDKGHKVNPGQFKTNGIVHLDGEIHMQSKEKIELNCIGKPYTNRILLGILCMFKL